jgi:small subunit ribosomal protein S17
MSKKKLSGRVVSLATPKTAKVEVSRQWQHPLYLKSVKRSKNYACHYEDSIGLKLGDKVMIEETKPYSKTKHFKVVAILDK